MAMQLDLFDPRGKTTAENTDINWLDHWLELNKKLENSRKIPGSVEPEELEKLLDNLLKAKAEGEDREMMLDMALRDLNGETTLWSKVLFNNAILGDNIKDLHEAHRDAFHAFSDVFLNEHEAGDFSEDEIVREAVLWLKQKNKLLGTKVSPGDMAGHACQFAYLTQIYLSPQYTSRKAGGLHDAPGIEIDQDKLMATANTILETAGLQTTSPQAMSEMLEDFKHDRANGILALKLRQTVELMRKIYAGNDIMSLLQTMKNPSFSRSFISESQKNAVLLSIFQDAGQHLNNQVPQFSDTSAEILRICFEQVTGTFEMIQMKVLIGMSNRPDSKGTSEKLIAMLDRKLTGKKDLIEKTCHTMDMLEGKNLFALGGLISSTLGLVSRIPHLQDQLIETLKNPDLYTFETACVLTRELVQRSDFFKKKLIRSLFSTSRDLIDPQKSAIIINMLRGIRDVKTRKKFFYDLLAGNDGALFRNPSENERFLEMIKTYNFYVEGDLNAVLSDEPVKKSAEPGFELLTISAPPRDLDGLKEFILRNRSINISHDGNRLGKTGVDSPLEDEVAETRVTNNKDSRKFPASLACNICVKMKSGVTHYLRMTKDNELLLRVLENGQTKNEGSLESLATNELEANTLREMHYFVLCKLRDIFVRRKAETPEVITGEIKPPKTEPKPDDSPNPAGNDDPLTTIRKEEDHFIDITTPALQDMPVDKLISDEEEDDREKKKIAKKISANQKKVLTLLKAVHEGMVLPAIIPAEWSDIIIYERLPNERKRLYRAVPFDQVYQKLRLGEINLQDYHIRTVRAFTQALPFEKRFDSSPLKPEEVVRVDRETGLEATHAGDSRLVQLGIKRKTRQTALVNRKMSLFLQSGESYGLNMSPKPQLLIFQADDNPANRALFEAMRNQTDEQIREDVSFRIKQALEKNLKMARRKIVSPQMMGQVYQEAEARLKLIAARMKQMAAFQEKQRIARAIELRDKMVEETIIQSVRLRLPQVFIFEQTFNQGQFQSLSELWEKQNAAQTDTDAAQPCSEVPPSTL